MRVLVAAFVSFVFAHATPARADAVHDALEAYALYQNDVSVLTDVDIDGARVINGALARVARHDPERVARGFIAYGALTAAQSPQFAAGVQRRLRIDRRGDFAAALRADPSHARREIAGASHALRLVLGAARDDSSRAIRAGARFDGIARNSETAWIASSERRGVTLASARLTPQMRDRLRFGASDQHAANAFGARGFWDTLAGREAMGGRGGGAREERTYTDVANRMLAVGALVVAEQAESARVSALLDEPITQQCLSMQRLQLRQCLSVSVNAGERTYCLGQHGLTGPGSCFAAMVR
jgi:hypothetical protein